MTQIVRLIQGTEAWLNHRALHRNASETAAVLGISPWLTRYQLWELKTGRRHHEATYPMLRGIELEPKARLAYEEKTGHILEPVVMVDGHYSASLDGLSLSGELVLEVKCPLKGKDSNTWRTAAVGLVERHYELQVQHQLMVSGADKADFYVFDGQDGIVVEVLPSKDDFHMIREAWDEFWPLIAKDTPPELSAGDTVIRTDDAWVHAAKEYLAKKKAAEEALTSCEGAKSELVALANHSSERGGGVSVCRFWKGKGNSKEEVRVTATKKGGEP